MKKTFFIFLALAIYIGGVATAHAESVVWSGQGGSLRGPALDPDFGSKVLTSHAMSVQYNVRARKENGTVIACNGSGTLTRGERVLFEFLPHTREDVYWFAVGANFDSPYGWWTANATPVNPKTDVCVDANYVPNAGNYNFPGGTPGKYASFVVNPPVKSINAIGQYSCSSYGENGSMSCVPEQIGQTNPEFIFSSTFGHFYTYGMDCAGPHRLGNPILGYNYATGETLGEYTPSIPSQKISCPITIIDNVPTDTPTAPTVTTTGASCTLETPYTIQMQATDPNNDRIRYGIDWDNNGSVDQFVPPSGYVASGTTQTAARTYTTPGTKTIRIFAQDEGGLTSGVTTTSFNCTAAASVDDDDTDETLIITALDTGGGDGDGSLIDLSLRAIPSLVPPGERTRIHWSSTNADSCTVTAPNGDSWGTTQSPIGGESSSPITEETIYTLRCLDTSGTEYTQTARVNVLPLWSEF